MCFHFHTFTNVMVLITIRHIITHNYDDTCTKNMLAGTVNIVRPLPLLHNAQTQGGTVFLKAFTVLKHVFY